MGFIERLPRTLEMLQRDSLIPRVSLPGQSQSARASAVLWRLVLHRAGRAGNLPGGVQLVRSLDSVQQLLGRSSVAVALPQLQDRL
jgi:hypothetical protein